MATEYSTTPLPFVVLPPADEPSVTDRLTLILNEISLTRAGLTGAVGFWRGRRWQAIRRASKLLDRAQGDLIRLIYDLA